MKRILMVGPDMEGLGGISRVVKTWSRGGFFNGYEIDYVTSMSDMRKVRWVPMVKGLFRFLLHLLRSPDVVYIHTSVSTSFFRKSLYVLFARILQRKVLLHIHPTRFFDFMSGLTLSL